MNRAREGGEATAPAIRYTVVGSTLGDVAVGATGRGVCAVLLGEAATLADDLACEFPGARLERADDALRAWAADIAGAIEGGGSAASVPLDLLGTGFQRRVWDELRRIPAGATAAYGEVAERIGRPTAVRAVAGACAGNHAAIVVPCHRVVRTDGGLGGYRWGIGHKEALLERESRVRGE